MGNGPAQPERQDDPTDPEDGQAAAPGAPHVLIVGTPDGSLRWLAAIPTRRKNYADGGIPAAFAGILMTDGYRRGYGTSLHGQSPASIAAGSRVTATSASTLSVPTSPLLSPHFKLSKLSEIRSEQHGLPWAENSTIARILTSKVVDIRLLPS